MLNLILIPTAFVAKIDLLFPAAAGNIDVADKNGSYWDLDATVDSDDVMRMGGKLSPRDLQIGIRVMNSYISETGFQSVELATVLVNLNILVDVDF